jgi:neurotransmitter-gated ion-channel
MKTIGVVLLLLLGVGASAAAAVAAHPLGPPARDVPVRMGLFIAKVTSVGELYKEGWKFSGELRMLWNDPRLRFRATPGTRRHYEKYEIWTPRVHIVNAFEPRTSAIPDIVVDPSGRVAYSELIWASVSTQLDVHRFPFDSERLPVIFEPLGQDESVIRLIADPSLSDVNRADFTPLSEWSIQRLEVGMLPVSGNAFHPAHKAADFDLIISRNAQSFVWKFMVPLFAIVVTSWLAFWMPSDEYGIKEQLGIAVTTLLTTVAFTLALTTFLPRVAYFTFIDGYVLFCFLWVLAAMAIIYVEAFLRTHGREGRATRLRHIAAFALPIAFLVAQATLFFVMRPA